MYYLGTVTYTNFKYMAQCVTVLVTVMVLVTLLSAVTRINLVEEVYFGLQFKRIWSVMVGKAWWQEA